MHFTLRHRVFGFPVRGTSSARSLLTHYFSISRPDGAAAESFKLSNSNNVMPGDGKEQSLRSDANFNEQRGTLFYPPRFRRNWKQEWRCRGYWRAIWMIRCGSARSRQKVFYVSRIRELRERWRGWEIEAKMGTKAKDVYVTQFSDRLAPSGRFPFSTLLRYIPFISLYKPATQTLFAGTAYKVLFTPRFQSETSSRRWEIAFWFFSSRETQRHEGRNLSGIEISINKKHEEGKKRNNQTR